MNTETTLVAPPPAKPSSTLNISSKSEDWRSVILSNFTIMPFCLDGRYLVSMEGFIQAIKFPPTDPRRLPITLMWGKKAKEAGQEAKCISVWWDGAEYAYRSPEHEALIRRALEAKFHCNEGARVALKSTGTDILTHDVGPESPQTSLPAEIFCRMLTEIRANTRSL